MTEANESKKPEQTISLQLGTRKPVKMSATDAAEIISLLAGAIADGRDCLCQY